MKIVASGDFGPPPRFGQAPPRRIIRVSLSKSSSQVRQADRLIFSARIVADALSAKWQKPSSLKIAQGAATGDRSRGKVSA